MSGIKIKSIAPIETGAYKLCLTFVAGPGDPDYRDSAYQEELHGVQDKLKALGNKVQARAHFQKSGTGGSWLTGDFLLQLSALGTPLGTLFGVWIAAKLGRKVRIKVGDIEVEAGTMKEVEHLLERARGIKAEADKTP
ncbi:MAG TPA: hypothetical protein VE053_01585 [Allosphingosinicella sp.]|nr:hypothetical protein [Allosphingosinicella sp.]